MITKEQAINANEFHWGECVKFIGPRGGVTYKTERWHRNGRTQTWKTRPNDFRVPLKHGLRDYYALWHDEARTETWHTAEDCKPRIMKVARV